MMRGIISFQPASKERDYADVQFFLKQGIVEACLVTKVVTKGEQISRMMEREGGMSSINFHLEEQGQEGRSCQYSAIPVAGSCTIFYDVTFYVTYLQHELHQNLRPMFAMGFFCWTTCKVRDCLRLSSLTPHLCKHYGGWSGISLGVAVKSVWLSTLHCERSLHDGKDKIIRTSLRKERKTDHGGRYFFSFIGTFTTG